MMSQRQRIIAALRGKSVDRIPWAPRWELFFNAARADGRLPERYEGWSLFDVARDLGFGIKGNSGTLFELKLEGVDTRTWTEGLDTFTEYRTPFGDVRAVIRETRELIEEGVRGLDVEYPIKSRSDYDPVFWLLDHTRVVPRFDEWDSYERLVGDDGLCYPQAGPCPFHKVQRVYTGYQQSYYELNDNLPLVERLVDSLQNQFDQIADICAQSNAAAVEADGNYDISLHPPSLFARWFADPLTRFGDRLHAAGKIYLTHADGQMAGLLEPVLRTGVDVMEAWSPFPQTTLTTADALKVWGGKAAIWGGLPTPILREAVSEREFESYFFRFLREIAPGTGVCIGTGDNFPTDSSFDRVRLVTRLVDEYCSYPLRVESLPD